jgi:TatD DNase family protein
MAFSHLIVLNKKKTNKKLTKLFKSKYLSKSHRIHLHCFTGGWQLATKYLDEFENLCIGVTPLIGFNVSLELEDFVRKIPLDRLLLETDAPYFVPRAEKASELFFF